MSEERLEISVRKPQENFKEFVNQQGNKRILFSGKYGIGKTTFLKEFFNEDKKTSTIWLNPVRYSASHEKDIVSLLKYDIVYQILLTPEIDDQLFNKGEEEISGEAFLPFFLYNNRVDIAISLLPFLGLINQSVGKLFGAVPNLKAKFNNQLKEINSKQEKSTVQQLQGFYERIQLNPLFEIDVVNDLISAWCEAEIKEGKKPILIIDDLDRLHPNDLFRILNILSAGLSLREDEQGFLNQFSQIIVVCDIGNVRSIFKHMYGAETDFGGYIDKFVSIEPFYYSNSLAISEWIKGVFGSKLKGYGLVYYDAIFLTQLLKDLLSYNQINLRSLLKINPKQVQDDIILMHRSEIQSAHPFLGIYRVLLIVFNSKEELLSAFQAVHDQVYKFNNNQNLNMDINLVYRYPLSFIAVNKQYKKLDTDSSFKYVLENPRNPNSIPIEDDLVVKRQNYQINVEPIGNAFSHHPWHLLLEAIKEANKLSVEWSI